LVAFSVIAYSFMTVDKKLDIVTGGPLIVVTFFKLFCEKWKNGLNRGFWLSRI